MKVQFCANAAKTPKLALMMLAAHEFGHAIDLCHLPSRLLEKVSDDVLSEDFEATARTDVRYFLDTDIRKSERLLRLLTTVESRGGVKVVDNGISRARHPVLKALQCLPSADPSYPVPPTDDNASCESAQSESSAQVWAAKVMVAYMRQHPPQSRQELLSLFANSMPSHKHPSPIGKELDMDVLILSNPFTQAQYGCKPTERPFCLE